jgi:hypothetical protein
MTACRQRSPSSHQFHLLRGAGRAKRKAGRNSLASNEVNSRQKKRKISHKKKEENSDEIHVKTVKNLAAQVCAVDERFCKLLQPLQDTFRRKFEATNSVYPTERYEESRAQLRGRDSAEAQGLCRCLFWGRGGFLGRFS